MQKCSLLLACGYHTHCRELQGDLGLHTRHFAEHQKPPLHQAIISVASVLAKYIPLVSPLSI